MGVATFTTDDSHLKRLVRVLKKEKKSVHKPLFRSCNINFIYISSFRWTEIQSRTKNLCSDEAEVRGFISLACSNKNLSLIHDLRKARRDQRPSSTVEHEIAQVEANSFFSFKLK